MSAKKRLDLKVGFSCNNNCLFCAQAHKKRERDSTTEELKDEISAHASEHSEIVFTGGEPTIRKDIIELLSYARSCNYSLIQIQSNGRKFSDMPFALSTIKAGANSFSLALHGHTAELHDSLTCAAGSFKETKKGIKNLIELGQLVATNTVITKQNYVFLSKIAELLVKLSPMQSQFAFVHPIGNAKENINSVVAKMSDALPYIRAAVDILIEGNIEPRIEAVPPCLLPEYEPYLTERFIPYTTIRGKASDIDDWDYVRKNLAKSKFIQCEDCIHFLSCEGTWKEYPEKYGYEEFKPLPFYLHEVIIELTKKCNLRCEFCFNTQGNTILGDELSKEELFTLINSLKGKTPALRFTGGEPLLRQDLKEILEYAHTNGFYTILNTNGILFNEENFSLLMNVDDILISFHNLAEKENKTALFKKIKSYKPTLILRCCTTLTKENISSLDQFYEFMQFMPVDDWFLLRQMPNSKDLKPISKEEMKGVIDRVIDLNSAYRIKPKIANAVPFCVTEERKTASICAGGKNDSGHTRLLVTSNGDIMADYLSSSILGNVRKDDVYALWQSVEMNQIRNLTYLDKKCTKCSYSIVCKGGLSSISKKDHLL